MVISMQFSVTRHIQICKHLFVEHVQYTRFVVRSYPFPRKQVGANVNEKPSSYKHTHIQNQ